MRRGFWILGALLLLGVGLASPASAQPAQTLIMQWEIDGPAAPAGGARPPFDVATAQGYAYKAYIVGSASGVAITGVQCTTTADPFVKTCSAPVPSSGATPGLNLDMTVTINGVESAHSTPAVVPPLILPPTAPRNFRMLRSVTGPTG